MPVVPIYHATEVVAAEQRWAEQHQQPTWVLMQRAARAARDFLMTQYPERTPVVCLCGPGNNGGDGLLLATELHALGWPVMVWQSAPPRAGDFWAGRCAGRGDWRAGCTGFVTL